MILSLNLQMKVKQKNELHIEYIEVGDVQHKQMVSQV